MPTTIKAPRTSAPADEFSIFDSPLGPVAVAFNIGGVSAVGLVGEDFAQRFQQRFGRPVVEGSPPPEWASLIKQALEIGQPLSLPIDFGSVTAFQKQVLIKTAAIPRGQTRSYGWLADQVDRPRAARAVGQVMAANPVPLIIPCHRVVQSDGKPGHYGLGGVDQKRRLLRQEEAIG